MHYYEELPDGTVIGLYDGSQQAGEIDEEAYLTYHDNVARREHPAIRGHALQQSRDSWPMSAIENARVRTALISAYRIHTSKYFLAGTDFPKTWERRQAKIDSAERFSPPGTLGFYFGLTVDAALDEARYVAGARSETDHEPQLLLVHRSYFNDLLYLAPVLPALWEHLKLPEMPTWEMYLTIMNPATANEITDAIGLWARAEGFKGIIYPSARYGQNLSIENKSGSVPLFPMLNFVEIGSHVCEQGLAIQLTMKALISGLAQKLPAQAPTVVYSEPNLVVFDDQIVAGVDRPVFYTTYSLGEADYVRQQDERSGLKHKIELADQPDKFVVFVDDLEYRYALEYPKH